MKVEMASKGSTKKMGNCTCQWQLREAARAIGRPVGKESRKGSSNGCGKAVGITVGSSARRA